MRIPGDAGVMSAYAGFQSFPLPISFGDMILAGGHGDYIGHIYTRESLEKDFIDNARVGYSQSHWRKISKQKIPGIRKSIARWFAPFTLPTSDCSHSEKT